MERIVDLATYRRQQRERRIFAPWRRRFGETFPLEVGLPDLAPRTLRALAMPGEESNSAIEAFIAAVRTDAGRPPTSAEPVRRVDIHLFLSDQLRFEVLLRLHWVEAFTARTLPLHRMVADFESLPRTLIAEVPELCPDHPRFAAYALLNTREKAVFVRRLIADAITAFSTSTGC
jgi:hypothetical protein